MPYALGVDVGTSFTAAAITQIREDGQAASTVLKLGQRGDSMPSVVYFGDDGQLLIGEAAERRGLEHPHRLVREFKRRLGDDIPIIVGEISAQPQEILAAIVRWVVDRAEERQGEPPSHLVLTHPAGWGGYKTGLIREALGRVGLTDVFLISEPEAAAIHYATQERVDPGSLVAVYDLGGGTFDIALLRKTGTDSFESLGRPAGLERLGGADFDEAVFRHVLANAGDAARLDPEDPSVLMALTRLRRECVEAKEALSFDSEASIPVLMPGIQRQVRLVRTEFEELIEEHIRDTVEVVAEATRAAGIEVEHLSAILLIGGSSRIPLVAELLSAELGRPIAVDADPKAAICLGAAMAPVLAEAAAAAEARATEVPEQA
ncbi:MAG: Hsp70 family protein, partial [Actinomycetota bacterium]|nr:Hsp70 family protein [Actinomycetota bacterium]